MEVGIRTFSVGWVSTSLGKKTLKASKKMAKDPISAIPAKRAATVLCNVCTRLMEGGGGGLVA